jgi:hypothetical protein
MIPAHFGKRAAVLLSFCLCSVADASVVYNNEQSLTSPDRAAGISDQIPDIGFKLRLADDFVLQQGGTVIRDVHGWGVYVLNTPLPRITSSFESTVAMPLHLKEHRCISERSARQAGRAQVSKWVLSVVISTRIAQCSSTSA